jgi:hypothetical protein
MCSGTCISVSLRDFPGQVYFGVPTKNWTIPNLQKSQVFSKFVIFFPNALSLKVCITKYIIRDGGYLPKLRTDDTNKLFFKIMKITTKVIFILIK